MALGFAYSLHQNVKILFVEHLENQALNQSISTDLDENEIKAKASDRPTVKKSHGMAFMCLKEFIFS
ncbi:MAG: hypothetical protein GY737_17400 [Desulfobacteraceae bacterium]|nr:hypothetical protein [Desulfobacteraceae bacterium]